ncbi:MAG: hypothetical protein CME70_06840 [Halobacteriovorax sp.]|nr:hypothetical protein [Halobacteriovorax sp.]|tara:strand:+ start:484008 stop:484730 length:723 start_codon:yes stop_codon:yes gene_type:complete
MKLYLLKLYFLIFLGFSSLAFSAVYIPTPLEDQIKESYGVIRGKYQSKVYKKNSRGEVITEISIALDKSSGLKPGDIINKNNFKVTIPGGVWQGIVHKYSGSPEFSPNEDVVLLINRGSNGFHLLNFGLGKYTISKEAGTTYLNSAIFPKNSQISGIRYQDFQSMVEDKFGEPLSDFKGEKFVYNSKKLNLNNGNSKSSRAPASINQERPENESNTAMFWLMIVLSVLGTSSYKLFNRKG